MTTPRPTIYKIPSKQLPKKQPTEKDQRLWKKRRDSVVHK